MSEVRYQNKKLGKTLQNDNNTRQYDKTYCKSFLKSDNPILVELLPKKSLQSLITVVTLLSYSTINFDKSYT